MNFRDPITEGQKARAFALYTDMVVAAARHGITPDDFNYVVNLGDACRNVVKHVDRQEGTRT